MPGLEREIGAGGCGVQAVSAAYRSGGTIADTRRALAAEARAGGWKQAVFSYEFWPIAGIGPDFLDLMGGMRLHSVSAAQWLPGARWLAAGVCTLGGEWERQVHANFAAGEPLRALLLDEIGSQALYRLAARVEARVRREARQRGLEASGVLNPGEPGLELREQRTVVRLAGGSRIGVSVSHGEVLSPMKSLTLIMGVGKQMPVWGRDANCARCAAKLRCTHRRVATGPGST